MQYEDYNEEAQRADKKTRDSLNSGEWQRWEDGDNWGRILPAQLGKKSPYRIAGIHRIKVSSNGQNFNLTFKCTGPGCLACAEAERLFRTGNEEDRKVAKDLKAKSTTYFLWIDRENEDAGPRKAQVTDNVFNQIVKLHKRYGNSFSADPKQGYDICIEKIPAKSKDNNTDYPKLSVYNAPNKSAIGTPEQLVLWEVAWPDLDLLVPVRSLDEVRRALNGGPLDGNRSTAGGRERKQVTGRREEAPAPQRRIQDDVIDANFETGEDDLAF